MLLTAFSLFCYNAPVSADHGGLYPASFASLLMTATPEPTITARVDELMQQWIADPKPTKASWTNERS